MRKTHLSVKYLLYQRLMMWRFPPTTPLGVWCVFEGPMNRLLRPVAGAYFLDSGARVYVASFPYPLIAETEPTQFHLELNKMAPHNLPISFDNTRIHEWSISSSNYDIIFIGLWFILLVRLIRGEPYTRIRSMFFLWVKEGRGRTRGKKKTKGPFRVYFGCCAVCYMAGIILTPSCRWSAFLGSG